MITRIEQSLFVIIMFGAGLGYTTQLGEEFILNKDKNSSLSASRMKEEIEQTLFDTFGQLTSTLEFLAQAQKQLFNATRSILEDQCLNTCKKQQLSPIHQKASAVQTEAAIVMKHAERLVRETQALIKTLHKE